MAVIDTINKELDIAPSVARTVVNLSQNENGRTLNFVLRNVESMPAGSTVTLSGTKPDGVVYSAVGSLSDLTATFTEDTQLTAVAGEWLAKIQVTNSGNTVATAYIYFIIEEDPVDPDAVPSSSQLDGIVAQCQAYANALQNGTYMGAPAVASQAADMTDTDKIYVYAGNEAGYNNGHWYYYDSDTSTWVDGGMYGSVIQIYANGTELVINTNIQDGNGVNY